MATQYLVNVDLSERSYPIHIQRDSFCRWSELLKPLLTGRRCLIISDSNVYAQCADQIVEILADAGAFVYACVFPAGESSKSLERLDKIYHKAASAGLGRDAVIIALGGGVSGDIGGFVAATWMRGVKYVQIPTSLLAMVDSSVGGKTGIDLPEGKNLVGAFWQPEMVLIDPDLLKTLPEREFACGLAEIVKYGVIADRDFFERIEANVDKILNKDFDFYTDLVTRSCEIKAAVVSADEREQGLRMHLNFGHTFGHAVEALGGYEGYTHGESVAIGMCVAMDIAVRLKIFDPAEAQRVENLLTKLGLPTRVEGDYPADALLQRISLDKKQHRAKPRWVLPETLGRMRIATDLPDELLMDVIRDRS